MKMHGATFQYTYSGGQGSCSCLSPPRTCFHECECLLFSLIWQLTQSQCYQALLALYEASHHLKRCFRMLTDCCEVLRMRMERAVTSFDSSVDWASSTSCSVDYWAEGRQRVCWRKGVFWGEGGNSTNLSRSMEGCEGGAPASSRQWGCLGKHHY